MLQKHRVKHAMADVLTVYEYTVAIEYDKRGRPHVVNHLGQGKCGAVPNT